MRVAIVEDDIDQARHLEIWLKQAGYDCHIFGGGHAAIKGLQKDSYDLVLLDWLLPDLNGDEVLGWVRSNIDWKLPVIFVTQRDSAEDLAYILDLGADDYITKPIQPIELLARIKALLRRAAGVEPKQTVLEFDRYRFDTQRREAFVSGEPVTMTQKEFELAVFLFKHIGRLLSRSHLLESVWGHSADLNTRTLDTHISRIRKKLNLTVESGWRLSTVYHHGYRLEHLVEPDQQVG